MSPSQSSEGDWLQLIQKIRTGDQESLAELLKKIEPQVKRKVLRSLWLTRHRDHDANDIIQDSLLRITIKLNGWHGRGTFPNWVNAVVGTCISNHFRKKNKFGTLDPQRPIIDPASSNALAQEKSWTEYVKNCLEEVLSTRPNHRLVFDMTQKQEKKQIQVAQETGIADRTIREYLREVRILVQECLEKHISKA